MMMSGTGRRRSWSGAARRRRRTGPGRPFPRDSRGHSPPDHPPCPGHPAPRVSPGMRSFHAYKCRREPGGNDGLQPGSVGAAAARIACNSNDKKKGNAWPPCLGVEFEPRAWCSNSRTMGLESSHTPKRQFSMSSCTLPPRNRVLVRICICMPPVGAAGRRIPTQHPGRTRILG